MKIMLNYCLMLIVNYKIVMKDASQNINKKMNINTLQE